MNHNLIEELNSFGEVLNFVQRLRGMTSLWEQLLRWKHVYWLSIQVDHASMPGGAAQQRRIAKYQAVKLFGIARHLIARLVGAAFDADLPTILEAARDTWADDMNVEPRNPFERITFLHPGVSPARDERIPMIVLRDRNYYPPIIVATSDGACVTCSKTIKKGERVRWARDVGACHTTCRWPLEGV